MEQRDGHPKTGVEAAAGRPHARRADLQDATAFARAEKCFVAALTALLHDGQCMVRQPRPWLRPAYRPAGHGTAAALRRRSSVSPRQGPNPLSNLVTTEQIEDARISYPRGPQTQEDLFNRRPNTEPAHAAARANWGRTVGATAHAAPVYVLTAKHLVDRHRHIAEQLAATSLDEDVTHVLCGDREEMLCQSAAALSCLHPTAMRTPWINRSALRAPGEGMLAPGTLSLALKHKLAALDVLRRRLAAGLVLEDDAVLRPDVAQARPAQRQPAPRNANPLRATHAARHSALPAAAQVLRTPLPADADVAFLGSYRNYAERSLCYHPWANGTRGEWRVRRRSMGHAAFALEIIGSVAYILTSRGAAGVLVPVTAPSDVALSWFGSAEALGQQYGTPVWLAWQSTRLTGNTHRSQEAHAVGRGRGDCSTTPA